MTFSRPNLSRVCISVLPACLTWGKREEEIGLQSYLIGARAYYLKTILHDWSDQHASEILRQLKPALTPGYSRVLINDVIIPSKKPDWKATGEDVAVMCIVGSVERTEAQWEKVVNDAGLSLVKFWTAPKALEGIIEMELPATSN